MSTEIGLVGAGEQTRRFFRHLSERSASYQGDEYQRKVIVPTYVSLAAGIMRTSISINVIDELNLANELVGADQNDLYAAAQTITLSLHSFMQEGEQRAVFSSGPGYAFTREASREIEEASPAEIGTYKQLFGEMVSSRDSMLALANIALEAQGLPRKAFL